MPSEVPLPSSPNADEEQCVSGDDSKAVSIQGCTYLFKIYIIAFLIIFLGAIICPFCHFFIFVFNTFM